MKRLKISEIASFLGNYDLFDKDYIISNIVTDSREVNAESLFIPIVGSLYDGHDFIMDCYDKGCRNFLVDLNHDIYLENSNIIKVSDTKKGFGMIAKGYKEKFDIPFIAITGSVGKTSTKDMIYGMLSTRFNTLRNEGNFNNEIGLPKTLLNLSDEHEIAIVEMGMYVKGEISYLKSLVNHNIGVITNVGMSHIENFDNQDGIFDAKMEIAEGFNSSNILIVNGDDKYLKTLKDKDHDYKLITCGFSSDNDIYCKEYKIFDSYIEFICCYNGEEHLFRLNNLAKHNILNAMIGIAVGLNYNFSYDELKSGLLNFSLSRNRLDILNLSCYRVIDDTYNASYDSMISALDVLNNFEGRRVAILGDIFELGKYSEEIHRNVGKKVSCDVLITIGDNSKFIGLEALENGFDSNNYYHFDDKESFYLEFNNIILDGDNILLKASNGMKFNEIVDYFKSK